MTTLGGVKVHHKKYDVKFDPPMYRKARWKRAVKVYTINQESRYLIVQGVPAVNASKELIEMFTLYGDVEEHCILKEYPAEEFTEVYWIKYARIQSARFGKRKLDNRSFFGGQLHVCYAPEYESTQDTREKLEERKRAVWRKCKEYEKRKEQNNANMKEANSTESELHAEGNVNTGHSLHSPVHTMIKNANVPDIGNDDIPASGNTMYPTAKYAEIQAMEKSDLPKIPTKQATLPVEIQRLTAEQVNPKYYKNLCKDIPPEKRSSKRIVWNSDSDSITYTYKAAPGAWDPYKDSRCGPIDVNRPKRVSADEIDETVCKIRKTLHKTIEPALKEHPQTQDPLQLIETKNRSQTVSSTSRLDSTPTTVKKKRVNDGRKRI